MARLAVLEQGGVSQLLIQTVQRVAEMGKLVEDFATRALSGRNA